VVPLDERAYIFDPRRRGRIAAAAGVVQGRCNKLRCTDEQAEDDARIVPAGNQDQPEYSEDGENAEYLDVMRRPVSAE
jgi:hypothetical protein